MWLAPTSFAAVAKLPTADPSPDPERSRKLRLQIAGAGLAAGVLWVFANAWNI
jgi:hypothetical protein